MPEKSLARAGPAFLLALVSVNAAHATVPTLDPGRGVMTMAPLLEQTTPAVVNRKPVANRAELRDVMEQAGGGAALCIARGSLRLFIIIQ